MGLQVVMDSAQLGRKILFHLVAVSLSEILKMTGSESCAGYRSLWASDHVRLVRGQVPKTAELEPSSQLAETIEFRVTDRVSIMDPPPVCAPHCRVLRELQAETGEFEAMSCTRAKICRQSDELLSAEVQEFSWRLVFSDPSRWWDGRQSNRHSNFTHLGSSVHKAVLWSQNESKPGWLQYQLVVWDARMKRSGGFVHTSIAGQKALPAQECCFEVERCKELCEEGRTVEAVDELTLLVKRGCHVANNIYYRVIKKCMVNKDLALGRRVHALTVGSGYEGDSFLATHLIALYASHERLEEAMGVFRKVSAPSAHNWAIIISAHARNGEAAQAIELYRQMRESTVKPGNRIYLAVLRACASAGNLVAGKEIHEHILASQGVPDIFLKTGLLDMYAKCGSLEDARTEFDNLPERDVVAWNAMLAGYARKGLGREALSLFSSMEQEGLSSPNSVTFVCLLQACASEGVGALHEGRKLHAQIETRKLHNDVVVGGSLVNMYSKCGRLDEARLVFDKLPDKNMVTWNAMLAGYAQQGLGEEALTLYRKMMEEGLHFPDVVTFISILQSCACVGVGALHVGKELEAQIEERGLQNDAVLGCSLINMYAKCGSLEHARSVFDRLSKRNMATLNAMLTGYAQQGMGQAALILYGEMQKEGLYSPDTVTFLSLLQSCASVGLLALHHGKQLHAQIKERAMQNDAALSCSLVDMYAKCGSLGDARSLFDRLRDKDTVTWNAMLAGYVQQGMGQEALSLYSSMYLQGLSVPNSVTFVCLIQACASIGGGALPQGKMLHAQIKNQGLQDDVVLGGCLVNMYTKCGSLEHARDLFDRLLDKSVLTWNAMLAGYVQQDMGPEALNLFANMLQEGLCPPNSVTFVCLLQACALVADLDLGKQFHAQIEDQGMQADVVVGAALVDMYAKCGSMLDSQQVFDVLPERSIEAWNALIGGYTSHGDSDAVFDLMNRMNLEAVQPDAISFLGVLALCSQVGFVDKGQKYFEVMKTEYGICPTAEHYRCMMDLLGRAGHLEEAFQMAKTMPFPPSGAAWHTLLGACRKWGSIEIGQQAFESAVGSDGRDAAPYVLMSSIYAKAQMWQEADEIQTRRKKCGAWKEPGQSWWTDFRGVVHTFVVGDNTHPECERIYARLEQLHLS